MRLIIVCLLLITYSDISNSSENIEKIVFKDKPNYKHEFIGNKPEALFDDSIVIGPIWTSQKGVAWVHKTLIEINVIGKLDKHLPIKKNYSFIKIHFGRRESVGVLPPTKIDVYTGEKNYFAGSFEIDYKDKELLWAEWGIIGPVKVRNEKIKLIVHTKGKVFAIDEIKIIGTNVEPTQSNINIVKTPRKYSIDLLRTENVTFNNKNRLESPCIKVLEPFVKIERDVFNGCKPDLRSINIIDIKGNKEHKILAIKNGSKDMEVRFKGNNIKGYKLESVLAADGKHYYDVLKEINEVSITVDAYKIVFIFLDIKLDVNSTSGIEFYDGNLRNLRINNFSYNFKILEEVNPYINMWPYIQDKPIWKNEEGIIADLLQTGVNVYVFHPQVFYKKSLKRELKKVKNFDQLLLFYPNLKDKNEDEIKKEIDFIVRTFEKEGLGYDRWAIYPLDEPTGLRIYEVIEIAKTIKQINKDIRIYANPITSNSEPTSIDDINELLKYIDIVQPSKSLVKKLTGESFSIKGDMYWMYGGPNSPVKSAPPYEYKLLWIDAWLNKSNGTGFWSFSDTSGSSAWNDYDGRRPDWAVVYESKDNESLYISSRRWEAFKSGAEDYKILKTFAIKFDLVDQYEMSEAYDLYNNNKIKFMDKLLDCIGEERKCLM